MKKIAILLIMATLFANVFGIGSFAADNNTYWNKIEYNRSIDAVADNNGITLRIHNPAEFAAACKYISDANNFGEDYTVTLELLSDIDLAEHIWTPINEQVKSKLIIRGYGHIITGLRLDDNKSGLFDTLSDAELHDFAVYGNVNINNKISAGIGGIVNSAYNCSFYGICSGVNFTNNSDDKIISTVSGIAGNLYNNTIMVNCMYTGSSNTDYYAIGFNYGNIKCDFLAAISKHEDIFMGLINVTFIPNKIFQLYTDGFTQSQQVTALENSFNELLSIYYANSNIAADIDAANVKKWTGEGKGRTGSSTSSIIDFDKWLDIMTDTINNNKDCAYINDSSDLLTVLNIASINDFTEKLKGIEFVLNNDIDLSGVLFDRSTAIAEGMIINGNGHNITIGENEGAVISYNDGAIRNLTVAGSAKVLPSGWSDLPNYNSNMSLRTPAGLIGANNGSVSNISMSADISVVKTMASSETPMALFEYQTPVCGGIVAFNNGTIENCAFTGTITVTDAAAVGAIAGQSSEGAYTNGYCSNKYSPVALNNSGTSNTCETLTAEQMTGNGPSSLVGKLNSWVDNNPSSSLYKRWNILNGILTMKTISNADEIIIVTPQHISHWWSEWTVDSLPSADTDGSKTRECRLCHETETRILPAYGDKYTVFKDVSEENRDAVAKCVALNILHPRTNSKFLPKLVMSVGDAATAAAKAYQFMHTGEVKLSYSDAIAYAIENSLITSAENKASTATVQNLCEMLGIESDDSTQLTKEAAAVILADYIG